MLSRTLLLGTDCSDGPDIASESTVPHLIMVHSGTLSKHGQTLSLSLSHTHIHTHTHTHTHTHSHTHTPTHTHTPSLMSGVICGLSSFWDIHACNSETENKRHEE